MGRPAKYKEGSEVISQRVPKGEHAERVRAIINEYLESQGFQPTKKNKRKIKKDGNN